MDDRKVSREGYSVQIKKILKDKHYTQSAPVAVKYCFVLRKESDGEIVGIILYGYFSRRQAQRKYENYLELSRLWLHDDEPKNTASWFISKTLNFLQKKTHLSGIVSYADPTVGHTGAVYKASNFAFIGTTRTSYHYTQQDGNWIHKKKIWRDAKKLGISEAVYAKSLGLEKVPEKEKLVFQFVFKRIRREVGSIYKITLPNTKMYIGQTVNLLANRLRGHISDAKRGSNLIFHTALRAYDYNCEISLIETAPIDLLLQREQFWISHYDTTNPEKGYNDGNAPLGILDRVPEDVLFDMFEMRKDGYTYQEISTKFGISRDYVCAVICGRTRPDIRARWIEYNIPPEKYKSVEDADVLRMFELHDAGKSLADIALEMKVTKSYVSLAFKGKMRWDLKDEYERKTGKLFLFHNTKMVDRELARKIIEAKYKEEVTSVSLAKRFGLSVDQVRDIVTGTTAKDVYDEYAKNNKVTKNFKYSDAKLISAFDLRFKQGFSAQEVANQLGIDRSFLSLLFSGKNRKNLKEHWETLNGPVPSKSEVKSQAALNWRRKKEGV